MHTKLFILFILFIPFFAQGQSLSKERVQKIKECTVQVKIEDVDATGTGFFIAPDGSLLTCWHVIQPAIRFDSANRFIGMRKITIVYNNGTEEEYEVLPFFLRNGFEDAISNDFCALIPKKRRTKPGTCLKIGDFDKAEEGQDIYTCGYPVGIGQQCITKGIISAKYIFPVTLNLPKEKKTFQRSQALLDMTMSRGISGGPIVKLGATADQDEVIGIADFIVAPVGQDVENISKYAEELKKPNQGVLNDRDKDISNKYFADTFSKLPIGLSGCVSINHVLAAINKIK
ncbi:MAG: serine protease [Flavipsychrobacter sp.]|nr:serine protease [Flavipsychrobacter sp.]